MIAVVAGRILGVPSLVHVAGGELVALPEIAYGAGWRGRLRERAVLRAAGRVTAASEPMLARLAALGVQGTRVPLGIDLRAWPPRQPLRRPPGRPPRLIHVASLNRVKDQTTLLSALALLLPAHPGLQMDIVGEDTLGGEIERLARRLGLAEAVTFHGFRTQRQLRPLMEQADLMLVSSRHEAGPIVVLEAAAVGVPTVGTTVGHLAEWAPQAALTVPIGDARALAGTAATVLADEDLRLSLARAAQAIALREDADFTARAFAALYAALLGRATPG